MLGAVAAVMLVAAAPAHSLPRSLDGTLTIQLGILPSISIAGQGVANVTTTGVDHLDALFLPGGFVSQPHVVLTLTTPEIRSVRFANIVNASGTLSGISTSSAGGGRLPVTGLVRLCILLADGQASVDFPLGTGPAVALGAGGTATVTGAINLTASYQPWTLGSGLISIHDALSSITTPHLYGLAHGPASVTSSTAAGDGASKPRATPAMRWREPRCPCRWRAAAMRRPGPARASGMVRKTVRGAAGRPFASQPSAVLSGCAHPRRAEASGATRWPARCQSCVRPRSEQTLRSVVKANRIRRPGEWGARRR